MADTAKVLDMVEKARQMVTDAVDKVRTYLFNYQ